METSTFETPRSGAHATPAMSTLEPVVSVAARTWHVDARLREDGGLLRPAERHPVGVEAVPRGELDLAQPLGGADVPVQARDDEAGRIAVVDRQGHAVHAQGDHGPSLRVHRPGRRKADREAVHGAAHDLVGARLDAGHVEHGAQVHAAPQGVADEVAADPVADAGDGHVLLELRHGSEVVVGQRRLAVHHALDRERPAWRHRRAARRARYRCDRTRRWARRCGVMPATSSSMRRRAARRPLRPRPGGRQPPGRRGATRGGCAPRHPSATEATATPPPTCRKRRRSQSGMDAAGSGGAPTGRARRRCPGRARWPAASRAAPPGPRRWRAPRSTQPGAGP